ncbi:MAG: hypothetical protein HC886_07015 [Leptolyngbyaceae cyanobacterium SM1_1_3]|nr:hypothetical protein [Leptolyngbyaceae cyanobacterium SM1_1_3]
MTFFVLCLSACSVPEKPTKAVVQQAIALQAEQIQQDLLQQLSPGKTELPKISVSDVKVERTRLVKLPQGPVYEVKGLYSLKVEFPNRTLAEPDNLFEVYLQRQPGSEIWTLVRSQRTLS